MKTKIQNFKTVLILILLLTGLIIETVSADAVTPPNNIKFCGYITHCNETGVYWTNPSNPDFGGVQIWFDNVYIENTSVSTHFFDKHTEIIGTHTISTHAFDNSSNINPFWENISFDLVACPGCQEGVWACSVAEYCDLPITVPTIPVPTVTGFIVNYTDSPLSIKDIKTEVGETWIKWSWTWNSTNHTPTIFVDGEQIFSTKGNEIIISDLEPRSDHTLTIYHFDDGAFVTKKQTTTLPSQFDIIIYFILSFVITLVGLVIAREPLWKIVAASVGLIFALYDLNMSYDSWIYLPMLPAIFAAAVIVYNLWITFTQEGVGKW